MSESQHYSFADYEAAALQALRPLLAENGGYLKAAVGYQGELSSEQAALAFMGRFPGVLVMVAGAKYEPHGPAGRGTQRQRATISVIAADRSLRAQGEGAVGTYRIMKDVRDILMLSTLLPGTLPLELEQETLPVANDTTTLYRADYALVNPKIAPAR